MKHYPLFTHKQLTKEKLFYKLNPESNYKDSIIRDLLHDLQNLVLKFIVLERFTRAKNVQNDYLLKELIERKQDKLFLRKIERIENGENNYNGLNSESIYNFYLTEVNKFNFYTLNTKTAKKEKANYEISTLKNCTESFIIYFITEVIDEYLKLQFKCNKYNINCEEDFICRFIENLDLDDIIENSPKDNRYVFIIEVYNSMYKAFRYFVDDRYYINYKKVLAMHSNKLLHSEISDHFVKLVNYCLLKINSKIGIAKFKAELMELYEIILKNNYYISDKAKYLPHELFRSILFLGLELKESAWILNHIKVNSKKLQPDAKVNMCNFGYAYFYNLQGEYEKSLSYVERVPLDNFNYKFDMKNLKLKNFFELNYFEEMFDLIHTYRENLRKSELLSQERKTRHCNFL